MPTPPHIEVTPDRAQEQAVTDLLHELGKAFEETDSTKQNEKMKTVVTKATNEQLDQLHNRIAQGINVPAVFRQAAEKAFALKLVTQQRENLKKQIQDGQKGIIDKAKDEIEGAVKDIKEGNMLTVAKYAGLIAAGGLAAKWVWDHTIGLLWDSTIGDKDHPGFMRKLTGWLAGGAGALLGFSLARGKGGMHDWLPKWVSAPVDVATGAAQELTSVARELIGIAQNLGIAWTGEGSFWEKLVESGGILICDGGKFFIHRMGRMIECPAECAKKMMNGEGDAWVAYGTGGVSLLMGRSMARALMKGRIGELLPAGKYTAMRFALWPALPLKDAFDVLKHLPTEAGRTAGAFKVSEHLLTRIFTQPNRTAMSLAGTGNPTEYAQAVKRWTYLAQMREGAETGGNLAWYLSEADIRYIKNAEVELAEALKKGAGSLHANGVPWVEKIVQGKGSGRVEEFRKILSEVAEEAINATKPVSTAANAAHAVQGAAQAAAVLPVGKELEPLFQGLKNASGGEKMAAGLEKMIAETPQLQKLLSENPKLIQNFNGSRRAQALLIGAVRSNETKEVARILNAAQKASKFSIGMNMLGVGADVFGLAVAYCDWQENGAKIELAKETKNEELQALYQTAYTRIGIEAGVSATSLVVNGVVMYSAYSAGATAGGTLAAGAAATLILLPVAIAAGVGSYIAKDLEEVSETWLRNDKDWQRFSPAQLLNELEKINPGHGGFLSSIAVGGLDWKQGVDTVETGNEMTRIKIIRSYLVKTAALQKNDDEKPEEFKKRFDQFISDEMDYIHYSSSGIMIVSPSIFEFAKEHARMSAASRQLKETGMSYDVTAKDNTGKEIHYNLADYADTAFSKKKDANHDLASSKKEQMLGALWRQERTDAAKQVMEAKAATYMDQSAKQRFVQQQLLLGVQEYLVSLEAKMETTDFDGIGSADIEGRHLAMYMVARDFMRTLKAEGDALLRKDIVTSKDITDAVTRVRKVLAVPDPVEMQRRGKSEGWSKETAGKHDPYLSIGWIAKNLLIDENS